MPLGGYVIDVVRGDRLIEIQTGSLGALGPKLDALLDHHAFRIVHPLAAVGWVESGGRRRRSPTRAGLWNVFDALVALPTLLDHPRMELQVVLVELTEVRSATDRARRGRRGRVVERRLDRVLDHRLFTHREELLEVLPEALPRPFTTADLARATGLGRTLAQRACYVLRHLELLEEVDRTRDGVRYAPVLR